MNPMLGTWWYKDFFGRFYKNHTTLVLYSQQLSPYERRAVRPQREVSTAAMPLLIHFLLHFRWSPWTLIFGVVVVVVFVFQLHMTSEMNNDFLQSFLQGHFHTGLLIEMKFVGSERYSKYILSKISPHSSNEYHSQNIIISIKVVLLTLTTVPIRLVFTSGSSSYLLWHSYLAFGLDRSSK